MQSLGTNEITEGRKAELRVVARVAPYLWPKGQGWVKRRVVIAVLTLVVAKVIAVATPYLYKLAVDGLAGEAVAQGGEAGLLALGAVALTVAYGMSRLFVVAFQQLRDVVFAKVAQRALRQLGVEAFAHIHRLSLRYHISRKTGGLSRVMERGVKGVSFLLRFILFSIGPLILELLMVSIPGRHSCGDCAVCLVHGGGHRVAGQNPA